MFSLSTCQGWECSRARDMHYFYYHFQSEEERRRISRLELFDEFEVARCVHVTVHTVLPSCIEHNNSNNHIIAMA